MNDLPKYVRNCNLYADDTVLDATSKTIDEVTDLLQLEINKLSLWFKHNHRHPSTLMKKDRAKYRAKIHKI